MWEALGFISNITKKYINIIPQDNSRRLDKSSISLFQ
jgi:hypothetical protein